MVHGPIRIIKLLLLFVASHSCVIYMSSYLTHFYAKVFIYISVWQNVHDYLCFLSMYVILTSKMHFSSIFFLTNKKNVTLIVVFD